MIQQFPEQDPSQQFSGSMNGYLDALLYGGRCIGYEDFTVDDAPLVTLTVPAGAKMAIINIQADTTSANLNRVVHFREDGGDPTTGTGGDGMTLPDNGIYECKGTNNMANFKIIGIEAGKSHTVRVSYYGAG